MFIFVFLLYISSCLLSSVIGGEINFSSFDEGYEYNYYTNSYNRITELTCNANSNNPDVTSITTTWFYNDTDVSIDTGNNVLQFQDVSKVVGLRKSRQYYCRADYSENGQNLYEDSRAIGVYIDYKITVTVNYTTTSQVIEIPQQAPLYIPVMTEDVTLSCDIGTTSTVEWSYQSKSKTGQNPLTLDRLTIEFGRILHFKDVNSPDKVSGEVYIQPTGSGVWLQQQDSYTQLSDREEIILTENRTLVCVSSLNQRVSNWYFSGDDATEEGTQVSDMIERDESKGFVKLTLPTSLPTNRAGYYYCSAWELTNGWNFQNMNHSIKIVSPNNPTTTTTPVIPTTTAEINSSPSIQLELSYTPEYDILFVGIDDVIVTCDATNHDGLQLNVSLVDVNNTSFLKQETTNDRRVQLEERIGLEKGNLSYKCTAVSERGSVEESITIRVENIYTQQVVDLRVYTNPYTQEVQLQWETSHPLIANEIFIVWLSRVNVSDEYEEIGRTDDTEYLLSHLSDNYHYSIRVQVVSRLNYTTYADIYYVRTETTADASYSYTIIISIAMVIIVILLLVAVVSIVLSCALLIGKRRTGHIKYDNSLQQSSTRVAKENIPLSNDQNMSSKHKDQSGYNYEPMQPVATGNREYISLEDQPSRNYCEITPQEQLEPNLVNNYENLSTVAK